MNSASCRCFVPGCVNSQGNTTNATFHEFPEELQEEWLNAIGRSRDTFIIDELVCSEHFESTDFENYDTIKTLHRNTIPSLKLPVQPEESSFLTDSQINSNNCQEIEQLMQKYNSFEKGKHIKIKSDVVCTVLKPNTDKSFKCETAPISTINVFLVQDESKEESHDSSSPLHDPEFSEYDSTDEYHLEYEDLLNCRTCLEQIGPDEGHPITEIHHKEKTLKEMIVYCIPQMASTLADTDLICDKCLENVKICVNFIENCLKVEAELLEGHDDHLSTNVNENDTTENNVPEVHHHISLDHNYIQKTVQENIQMEDVTEKNDFTSFNNPSKLTHECLECDMSFKTKNYLLDHVRRMHDSGEKSEWRKKKSSTYNCNFCEKKFMTKLGYTLHLQLSHRDCVENKKHTCKDCGDRFATLGDLSEHKQERHGLTCKICSQSFNTKKELTVHEDTHPKTHLCEVCGKGFKNRTRLKAHTLTHNDPNTHLCHKCGQGFKSQVSLNLHFKRHNPDLKFWCDQCPASFQQKYRLELHRNVRHLGIKEYKCTVCDKKFCYKDNLKSHYKLKHSEVKPYQCERCGIRFARSDYLRRHTNCGDKSKRRGFTSHKRKYRYKRGDSTPITCKLCDKVFKDIQMLRLHVKTHTKLRKYKCQTCNLTFTTSSNRDRHEKVHEDSSFRCEVCFKRMETEEDLIEHCLMSHESSKKYKCHICGELFGRKYLLHSHVAERHEDVEDFEKEKEVLYKVVMQDYLVDD